MLILFLCRQSDLAREALGYARAFERRGIRTAYADDSFPCNGHIRALVAECREKPALLLQPETSFPLFPQGLATTDIPTACCHYDVYAYTHRRTLWAMLFDYTFLFHPGFEEAFREAGHPNPIMLPHAVEQEFFWGAPEPEKDIDLAWVGRMGSPLYGRRNKVLSILAANFQMNDWKRFYPYPEMAKLYRHSKVGFNIGRDDYPEDANLRVFEIMAAGALLVTSLPSELEKLGFKSDTHFVGYHDEEELSGRIRCYLEHDAERARIAEAGRELVLTKHTYDHRVEEILCILEKNAGRLFAPARSWPEERVRQTYLDYYGANNLLGSAFGELQRLAMIRPSAAWRSLPPILGGLRRVVKNRYMKLTNTAPRK